MQELENILRCLKIGGNEEKVNLDFSIVNDMDYYTGIIFQGFINGVPSSILSGGRYDNLLRKLGKDADAIGFAVYLDLLERFDSKEKEYDVDTLLLYEEGALFDSMSVGENVAFGLKYLTDVPEADYPKVVKEKLALVGLKDVEHLNPSELCGGMKKRVALARVLAVSPKCILYVLCLYFLVPFAAHAALLSLWRCRG